MTEKNVPWIFGKSLTPFINAQARVSLSPADGLPTARVLWPSPTRLTRRELTGDISERGHCNETRPRERAAEGSTARTRGDKQVVGQPVRPGGCDEQDERKDGEHRRASSRSAEQDTASLRSAARQCFDAGSTTGPSCCIPRLVRCSAPSLTGPLARSVALSCSRRKHVQRCLLRATRRTTCTRNHLRGVDYGATATKTQRHRQAGGRRSHREPSSPGRPERHRPCKTWHDLAQACRRQQASSRYVRCTKEPDGQHRSRLRHVDDRRRQPTCQTSPYVGQRTASRPDRGSGPIKLLQVGGRRTRQDANASRCSCRRTRPVHDNFAVTIKVGGSLQTPSPPTADRPTSGRRQARRRRSTAGIRARLDAQRPEIGAGCTGPYAVNTGPSVPGPRAEPASRLRRSWSLRMDETGSSRVSRDRIVNLRILGSEKPTAEQLHGQQPLAEYRSSRRTPADHPGVRVPYGSIPTGSGNQRFPSPDFALLLHDGLDRPRQRLRSNPCRATATTRSHRATETPARRPFHQVRRHLSTTAETATPPAT